MQKTEAKRILDAEVATASDLERSPPQRPLQHRQPQLTATPEAGVDSGFDLIENREAAFDFIGNHGLLGDWWEGKSY